MTADSATTVTQTDHDHMSWHARQFLNNRLRAETIELTNIATHLRATITERHAALNDGGEAEANFAEAKTIHDQLPTDPQAAQHRAALHHELATRTEGWT